MDPMEMPYKLVMFSFVIVCLILTALLLFWPNRLRAINRRLKKWISTETWERKLNRTRDIDEQLLELHKIMGWIMLLLAAIFILLLVR